MACKTHKPYRCGECRYINHDAYRGAGKKVAVQVTESQKGCNNFIVSKKLERVG